MRTPEDVAARIYEGLYGRNGIKSELPQSSQRYGLNPSVLRFARFGEPIFKGLGSFERPAPVIFSVIFFTASYAKSASIKKIENRERRTLDP